MENIKNMPKRKSKPIFLQVYYDRGILTFEPARQVTILDGDKIQHQYMHNIPAIKDDRLYQKAANRAARRLFAREERLAKGRERVPSPSYTREKKHGT